MAQLIIDIRPSMVAQPFHRAFTKPVVELDGVETETVWGTTQWQVESGSHQIGVAFRYRGQRNARLALGRAEFTVDDQTAEVRLTAQLGARNGSSFTITRH